MTMENTNEKKWIASEIMLSYKSSIKPSQRPKITGSKDAYELMKTYWNDATLELVEQFKIILMNRANKVLGLVEISTGGIAATVVDPKLIFAAALKCAASGIILVHNHPSGNLKPSQADIDRTRKLSSVGKLLEISVLDHLILTTESYYSFADEGLM
jgi:DNA repair protein RadC